MSTTTIDVSGELKLAGVRKQSLRKTFAQIELQSSSILFLALQWNDMESHFDSLQSSLLQRQEQLVSVEESLQNRLEEVKSREERVKSLQESVDGKLKEIESNEATEKLAFEERMRELDSMRVALEERSREIETFQAAAEKRINALNSKEEQFRVLEKSSVKSTQELEDLQKSVKESLEEFETREKHLSFVEQWSQGRIEDIEVRESRIAESLNAIDLDMKGIKVKEKRLNEHEKALMFKEKRLVDRESTIELKAKRLGEQSVELELLARKVNERVEEVELNDQMVKERFQEVELKDAKLKELAEDLELKERVVKERGEELEVKEREVKERNEEVELRECCLKVRAEELEAKDREVKQRADEVDMLIDGEVNKRSEELEYRAKEVKELAENVELKEREVKERAEIVELKERELKQHEEAVEGKDRCVKGRAEIIDSKDREVKGHAKEVELKEQKIIKLAKQVDSKAIEVRERAKKLDLKERKLKERAEEVELKDREVKRRAQEVDLISEEVDLLEQKMKDRDKELELKDKEVKRRAEELESQEKMFGESQKNISVLEDTLNERYLEIELKEDMVKKHAERLVLKENTLGERMMRFESTENELAERSKELDVKEKGLIERIKDTGSAKTVIYDIYDNVLENSTGDKNLDFLMCKLAGSSKIINGHSFQMYSSEHWKEYETMRDEVAATLSECDDPGNLVLDVMQKFYPLSTENGNLSTSMCIMRKICIILLESLLRVSPRISCDTTLGAAKFAFDWITKLREEPEYDLEVLGFLLLLAAYDLASRFDNTALMTYLMVVTRHRQASLLCHQLGLVDKISDIIANLIKEEKYLDAFEMICTFKLAYKFQPLPLLRAYLGILRPLTNGRLEFNSSTKLNVFDKRIADVDRVIKCIEDQEQCSGYSSESLRNFVLELAQNKADIIKKKQAFIANKGPRRRKSRSARLASKMRRQQQCPPETGISASYLNACSSADSVSLSMQFPHQQGSHSAEASGDICTQIETEQEKVQNLKVYYQTCTTTFEQLMMVPTDMRHHIKEIAIELALQLKANINGETATKTDVFHFLQLVANYDLASSFSSEDLLCCIKMIQHRKQAPDFFRPLGLLNRVPGFIENLLKENCCLDAIRFISQFDLRHKFPLVPILKTYLNGIIEKTPMLAHHHPEDQNHSATRELSASRTVLEHIKNYKLELEYPPKILEDRIKELEDHIARCTASNQVIQQKNQNNIITSESGSPLLHPQPQVQPQHPSGIKLSAPAESTDSPPSDATTALSNHNPRPQAQPEAQVPLHPQPSHQSGIMLPGPTEITDSPPSNTTAHSNQTLAVQTQQVTQTPPHPQAQPSHQSGIMLSGPTEITESPPSNATTAHSNQTLAVQAQPSHQSGIMLSGPTEITDSPPSNATTAHSNQTPAVQAQQVTQALPHPQAQPSHQSAIKRPRAESTECLPVEVIAHSNQRPSKRNSTLVERYGSQNSVGHHFTRGYPTMSQYSGLHPYYSNTPVAYGRPGHTFQPASYVDHLMSYGGHGNGYRRPDYHNGHTAPYHLHSQPPAHSYPSFYR